LKTRNSWSKSKIVNSKIARRIPAAAHRKSMKVEKRKRKLIMDWWISGTASKRSWRK
tara:strand:+ start:1490 stop:1660 length:171 start_codon:yes stop_codon:yes gene_type:complete